MSLDDILKASQRRDLGLKAAGDGKMTVTGLPKGPKGRDEQWQELCTEWAAAKAAVNAAHAPVNSAFTSVASGNRERRNPTEAELDAWEKARAWEAAVRKKMDDFVKRNT